MEDDLQELRAEVQELREVSEDTNKVLHKMRRGIWWGRLFTFAWWLVIFGFSGAAYYYYALPVLEKAQQYYAQIQLQGGQAQQWGEQAQKFFSQYLSAPSGQSPQVPQSGQ